MIYFIFLLNKFYLNISFFHFRKEIFFKMLLWEKIYRSSTFSKVEGEKSEKWKCCLNGYGYNFFLGELCFHFREAELYITIY